MELQRLSSFPFETSFESEPSQLSTIYTDTKITDYFTKADAFALLNYDPPFYRFRKVPHPCKPSYPPSPPPRPRTKWVDDYEHYAVYDSDAEDSVDSFDLSPSDDANHGTLDSFPIFDESLDFPSGETCSALPSIDNDSYGPITSHCCRLIPLVDPLHNRDERMERKGKKKKKKKKKKKRNDSNLKVSVASCGMSHSIDIDLCSVEYRYNLSLIDNDVFEDTVVFLDYMIAQLQHPSSGPYLWELSRQLYDFMDNCPDDNDDLLWMAMEHTNRFLSTRQSYMSGDYINHCATVGSRTKKSYSNVIEITVALNQPTSTEYEWAAADELMYLTSLPDIPQIQAVYDSQLRKYEEYLEQREGSEPISLPDSVNVSAFIISNFQTFLSEPLPVEDIPKAKFILSPLAEIFVPSGSILSSTTSLSITKVPAILSDSESTISKLIKPLSKTLSPFAVPFVPRSIHLIHTGEELIEESLVGTVPLSPSSTPIFRAGCNLSPSHKEATKDVQWEAWRKKRKKNQYAPPLVSSSHQNILYKHKFVPATSFVYHDSPILPTPVLYDTLINLSNQEVVSSLVVLRCPRLQALRIRTIKYKRSYCGKFWYILKDSLPKTIPCLFQCDEDKLIPLSFLVVRSTPALKGNHTPSSASLKACQSPIRGHDPGYYVWRLSRI
jgi:hypothetical protein